MRESHHYLDCPSSASRSSAAARQYNRARLPTLGNRSARASCREDVARLLPHGLTEGVNGDTLLENCIQPPRSIRLAAARLCRCSAILHHGTWLAATRYHPFVAGTCDWPRISHDALPNPFLALVVPEGLLGYERPDRMHIGLDPDVVQFDFNVNGLADPRTVERVGMGVNLGPGDLPAYGQVLKV